MTNELIAILVGGPSSEREISLKGGHTFAKACQHLGYRSTLVDITAEILSDQHFLTKNSFTVAINLVHGHWGEDGALAAWLGAQSIPYLGTGAKESAICFDKAKTKKVWQQAGLCVPKGFVIKGGKLLPADRLIEFPAVVKPVSGGSSIGLALVEDQTSLDDFLDQSTFSQVLVEQYIAGTEISMAILGDQILPSVQINLNAPIHSYQTKYESPPQLLCPADLSAVHQTKLNQMIKQAFSTLGCQHWGRIDCRYDGDNFYLLEINTVPGMTAKSIFPKAAAGAGLSYDALVQQLIDLTKSV